MSILNRDGSKITPTATQPPQQCLSIIVVIFPHWPGEHYLTGGPAFAEVRLVLKSCGRRRRLLRCWWSFISPWQSEWARDTRVLDRLHKSCWSSLSSPRGAPARMSLAGLWCCRRPRPTQPRLSSQARHARRLIVAWRHRAVAWRRPRHCATRRGGTRAFRRRAPILRNRVMMSAALVRDPSN